MRKLFILILIVFSNRLSAQDSLFLKVHFLYGSKPMRAYKDTEQKWFGGMLGGHAGIEGRSGYLLSFLDKGKFHVFAQKNNRHSTYAEHSPAGFYGILGGHPDSMKKAVVFVPINIDQKRRFDSIAAVYLMQVPYDYAFIGMRCGAATYEILAQLNILPQYTNSKTFRKIFYPRKLRKRLFKLALANGWKIERQGGTERRKWEHD